MAQSKTELNFGDIINFSKDENLLLHQLEQGKSQQKEMSFDMLRSFPDESKSRKGSFFFITKNKEVQVDCDLLPMLGDKNCEDTKIQKVRTLKNEKLLCVREIAFLREENQKLQVQIKNLNSEKRAIQSEKKARKSLLSESLGRKKGIAYQGVWGLGEKVDFNSEIVNKKLNHTGAKPEQSVLEEETCVIEEVSDEEGSS